MCIHVCRCIGDERSDERDGGVALRVMGAVDAFARECIAGLRGSQCVVAVVALCRLAMLRGVRELSVAGVRGDDLSDGASCAPG